MTKIDRQMEEAQEALDQQTDRLTKALVLKEKLLAAHELLREEKAWLDVVERVFHAVDTNILVEAQLYSDRTEELNSITDEPVAI